MVVPVLSSCWLPVPFALPVASDVLGFVGDHIFGKPPIVMLTSELEQLEQQGIFSASTRRSRLGGTGRDRGQRCSVGRRDGETEPLCSGGNVPVRGRQLVGAPVSPEMVCYF